MPEYHEESWLAFFAVLVGAPVVLYFVAWLVNGW